MISPARQPEVAELIARVYGLTAREREVTRLTMLGLSTREMASGRPAASVRPAAR
jgi:DNA-binding CsgD family transcriptional regulator